MAERKRPVTKPVKDGVDKPDEAPIDHELSKQQFNNLVRNIKLKDRDTVAALKTVLDDRMGLGEDPPPDNLGLKEAAKAAVKGCPDGSNNLDIQSVRCWAAKITLEERDGKAVEQLVALQATCKARLEL